MNLKSQRSRGKTASALLYERAEETPEDTHGEKSSKENEPGFGDDSRHEATIGRG